MKLKPGTWVVVADGEKALFLENKGDEVFPNLSVIGQMAEENPLTHEQGTDRPGRLDEGQRTRRTSVEQTDWHRVGKERFADEIADRLYASAHRGEFNHVVLIAPPLILGELRKKLHKEVEARILAEIPKTLTKLPVSEIEDMLIGE